MIPNPITEVQLKAPGVGIGLLGVAPSIEVGDDGVLIIDGTRYPIAGSEHWIQGMKWLPEGCALSGVSNLVGTGQMSTPNDDLVFAAAQQFQPFTVWARDNASATDQQRDRWGRARRGLLAERSYQIARELEHGTLATAVGAPNRFLDGTGLTTIDGGSASFHNTLNCIDGAVCRRLRNRQGMIHMTPEHLSAAKQLQWPVWNGSTAYSPNGNVIVADAGYTGMATVAGTSMIFGTDMIRILLGRIEFTPPVGDMASAQTVLDTNDLSVRAFQPVAYQWDGCCHLGITTDVTVCTPGIAE